MTLVYLIYYSGTIPRTFANLLPAFPRMRMATSLLTSPSTSTKSTCANRRDECQRPRRCDTATAALNRRLRNGSTSPQTLPNPKPLTLSTTHLAYDVALGNTPPVRRSAAADRCNGHMPALLDNLGADAARAAVNHL
jgi:hypothetical protein